MNGFLMNPSLMGYTPSSPRKTPLLVDRQDQNSPVSRLFHCDDPKWLPAKKLDKVNLQMQCQIAAQTISFPQLGDYFRHHMEYFNIENQAERASPQYEQENDGTSQETVIVHTTDVSKIQSTPAHITKYEIKIDDTIQQTVVFDTTNLFRIQSTTPHMTCSLQISYNKKGRLIAYFEQRISKSDAENKIDREYMQNDTERFWIIIIRKIIIF